MTIHIASEVKGNQVLSLITGHHYIYATFHNTFLFTTVEAGIRGAVDDVIGTILSLSNLPKRIAVRSQILGRIPKSQLLTTAHNAIYVLIYLYGLGVGDGGYSIVFIHGITIVIQLRIFYLIGIFHTTTDAIITIGETREGNELFKDSVIRSCDGFDDLVNLRNGINLGIINGTILHVIKERIDICQEGIYTILFVLSGKRTRILREMIDIILVLILIIDLLQFFHLDVSGINGTHDSHWEDLET